MPISIQAEENNHTIIGFNNLIINKIDNFFLTHPTKKSVTWIPRIKGKSKYAFTIPKRAYLISKAHADASDLFYLSEKANSGLKLQSNKSKNIDIFLSENNTKLILRQSTLFDTDLGLFLKSKEKISYGVNLKKDVIISKNTLGKFGVEQAKDEYTELNAKFVKLSNNENSELYGNINYELTSDYLNVGIGNTWFDVANHLDLTLGIHEQGKKVETELYATLGNENMKIQLGLDQIRNNSNMNVFFNLKFENILNKENFKTNVIIASKDSVFDLRKISLKGYRKKNLDILWKKYMNYN